MKYAPVLIPTVNRYTHFRECIESLARCTWADKTDVFVAVDYPPSEKYWEGYNKIKDYLSNCGDLGFHSLNVVYRETNYFFSGKDNLETLRCYVLEMYDRFIVSEDDNVFSPNFLVYVDKGLEKFKDDHTVLAINGYRHFYPVKFEGNTFFRQNVDFSAWGYGMWKDRRDKYLRGIPSIYFQNKLTLKNFMKVLNNGNNRAIDFLYRCTDGRSNSDDNSLSVLMPLEGLDVIMPRESLVRNMGWDGSGEHCQEGDSELANMHNNQKISSDRDFDFVGSGYEHYQENKRIYVRNSYGKQSWKALVRCVLSYFKNRIKSTDRWMFL